MKRRANIGFPALTYACLAAACAVLVMSAPAQAQSVVVDMSAVGGGSAYPGTAPGGFDVVAQGNVLFPPPRRPVSRLTGALAGQSLPALRRPAAAAPQSRATASRPAPVRTAPPPTPSPAPAPAAAPPPAPAPTPAPAPATQTAAAPPPTPSAPTQISPPPPPPSPAEEPVQAATADPAPTQTAAVTPGDVSGDETRILFEPGSADLTPQAKATLDQLATRLKADEGLRIQLQAFAAGNDDTAPEARRLSLKRALNVRGHLVEQDVRNTRMDVRALGIRSAGGPADRVDAVVVAR